ncbi:glycosyltransferase [Clostridium sp. YIM B02569]|uniref:glycosyltransferase family protein n=1 Tax=Clostridium sp. YIM B02569 TaxID=2911967 RepID=UPI001EEBE218|nr:glycosyltransferase [Clostridium sp. YIM B02569]
MNRFWDIVMKPCLEAINAKKIVEIGSDNGYGTKNLIKYCEDVQGTVISIDPFPKYDSEEWEKEHEGVFKLYKDLSLNRLPLLKDYDVILVDGDHNWYTVYNELKIIGNTFGNNELPLIFLHDIDWPYARRDLYYNPDNIPVGYRQAYAKKGMLPGELNLVDEGGLNDHLDNSIYENNPRNGVRTAIEDFIKEFPNQENIEFVSIPGFFGLGIVFDKKKHENILNVINNQTVKQDVIHKIEDERIDFIIKCKDLKRSNLEKNRQNTELNKENSELSRQNSELSKQNSELSKQNTELKNKIDNYIRIKDALQTTVQQKKADQTKIQSENDVLKDKYDNQLEENKKMQQLIKEKDKRINKLVIDNTIHLGSIKYRIGDAIVRGMKPSIDTIKMPVRIARLFKEGIQKKKKNSLKIENKERKESALNLAPKLDVAIQKVENFMIRDLEQLEKDKKYISSLHTKYIETSGIQGNPLVSIIVVNHNGADHLKIFFKSIIENIKYDAIELIVVDNASNDKSLDIINNYANNLDIKVIKNSKNETYSKANNQGAEIAKGEYFLFANNDIEVFEGWLEELLITCCNNKKIGVAGSLLFYPECPKDSPNKDKSFTIQHCGIKFNKTEERMVPYNYLNGKSPNESIKETTSIASVTGASLMVQRNKFFQVGGFTEEYIYGYEDVDFSLKLIKKGYTNYIVPSSMAYHFEFGTQSKQSSVAVSKRRLNNIKIFKLRWEAWLEKQYNESIFTKDNRFFDTKIKVAFAVTEAGDDVTAGDYFTAMEFGEAMKNRGWEIEFLKRKGPEDWYQVNDDVDIVIALLDVYDVRKVKCNNKNLVTVAWARNWFERWASKPYINDYTYVAASSEIACEYMEGIIDKKVLLLKIGSNKERFTLNKILSPELECDYCFTGSYWNDPREIIDMLNPQKYPEYKFNIYGANWDKIDKFAPYNKGFVSYSTMPEIYASTKIVIDDANRVTKPFGSVNSRVFDALCSGVLVITNGLLGAEHTFNKLLPTYTNEKELHDLITYYLTHEEERIELVKKLQTEVLEHHTYDTRVDELLGMLGCVKPRKTVIIKTPVPRAEIAEEWGDYHFALALIREFEKLGYEAKFQYLNQWNDDDSYADIIMVLRGLNKYEPKNYHYNIMWNISHPDKITMEEYYSYDTTYIASEIWAEHVRRNAQNSYTKIEVLLQCSDTLVFKPVENDCLEYELLFVGNSRKIFRKVIKDLIPSKYQLSVFGTNWRGLIPDEYIKGENIPNTELYRHYGGAKVVLNDHWDDMREKGFISNRIFDALACKSFIITDEVQGLEKYFGDAVVTYKDKVDLGQKIDLYISNEKLRQEKIKQGYEIVIKNHTFEQRVKQIVNDINLEENNYA